MNIAKIAFFSFVTLLASQAMALEFPSMRRLPEYQSQYYHTHYYPDSSTLPRLYLRGTGDYRGNGELNSLRIILGAAHVDQNAVDPERVAISVSGGIYSAPGAPVRSEPATYLSGSLDGTRKFRIVRVARNQPTGIRADIFTYNSSTDAFDVRQVAVNCPSAAGKPGSCYFGGEFFLGKVSSQHAAGLIQIYSIASGIRIVTFNLSADLKTLTIAGVSDFPGYYKVGQFLVGDINGDQLDDVLQAYPDAQGGLRINRLLANGSTRTFKVSRAYELVRGAPSRVRLFMGVRGSAPELLFAVADPEYKDSLRVNRIALSGDRFVIDSNYLRFIDRYHSFSADVYVAPEVPRSGIELKIFQR